jgi:hypothetical protein
MSFWQILGNFTFSDFGETVHKISDSLSISTEGTSYTTMGLTADQSDGFHLEFQRVTGPFRLVHRLSFKTDFEPSA